ncbi:hypothetical protein Thimo_3033 [Thioflavicoccus mobilis 8321]|uniref:HEPN domain-containing protein n=1 Tax=Thioflavicoccus mobilis 8321 TaxID=765912 RepID=L0H2A7_9GAMM|nr:hypothetical protein [Thioflavicoccus mobilis]AGA91724.1 hypothetical protein Thimo_3033 [Thioflavicoccus mobilis 8321]
MTNDQPEGVCAPLVLGVGQPTNGDAYLIVARELLPAVEVLSTADKIPPRGCALIAGHTLECTLKAYLWHKGKREELKCKKVRHNIIELWKMAYAEGTLGIPEDPPNWVRTLSEGHGPNFYLRYQEGQTNTVVHGGATPKLVPMATELCSLFHQIVHQIEAEFRTF